MGANQHNYDLSQVYANGTVKLGGVPPKALLDFAKQILFFLFVLVVFVFSLSYAMSRLSPENKELMTVVVSILDITKTAVPSIVSLVLGFYFGRKETVDQATINDGTRST